MRDFSRIPPTSLTREFTPAGARSQYFRVLVRSQKGRKAQKLPQLWRLAIMNKYAQFW
jgi:hypothetical protein